MNSQPSLFFILGRPRSGTSLLRTLFDAHPNVKIPPEYPLLFHLYQKYRHITVWTPESIREFIGFLKERKISKHLDFGHLELDEASFTRDLAGLGRPASFPDLFLNLNLHAGSVFPKTEILAVGDKNPVYSVYAGHLRKIFPGAKFICIVRDFRDNFASLRKFEFEAPNPYLQAYRWKYQIRKFIHYQKKYPESFYIVRYEELVADPEKTFMTLCGFLDIPYTDEVFEFYTRAEEVLKHLPPEVMERFMAGLKEPVNTSKIGLWRRSLSNRDVEILETVIGKYSDKMGYERTIRHRSCKIRLRSRIPSLYGFLLFRVMVLFSYLPYSVSSRFAGFLPRLAQIYHRFVKS